MKVNRGSAAVSPERQVAAAILAESGRGRRLDVAWEAAKPDAYATRGWIRTLVYGTVRLQGRLDHIVGSFLDRPVVDLDPPVRLALRMGAYQILYMGSVPDYAAVSESVAMVKGTRSRGAAGLVNAVLRKVVSLEEPESLFPAAEDDLVGHLVSWGSHPEWLIRRWIQRFGDDGTSRLVHENNQEPAVFLNPVGVPTARALELLQAAGLEGALVDGSRTIRLARGTNPSSALAAVPSVIQDPAAAAVAEFADPPEDGVVADLCAAPGGKGLALSAAARWVVAADVSEPRMSRLSEGISRLDTTVFPVVADARRPPLACADLVLVDAPCSGTGTLRRHPDGRWRVQETDLDHLIPLQAAILEGAQTLVPSGGLLVYATCTLEDEENLTQVNAFLNRHSDFHVEAGPARPGTCDQGGFLNVLPQDTGFDGAFAARLRRTG
ncbi:MAG: RsmB/NOP family class I SAM-dependent RNA methyltransferase [Longimicrobiales bacterium]